MSKFNIHIEDYNFGFELFFNTGTNSISDSNFKTQLTLSKTSFSANRDGVDYNGSSNSYATFKMNFIVFYTDGTNLVVPIVDPIKLYYKKYQLSADHIITFLHGDDIIFYIRQSTVANITINPQKNIRKIGIKATLYNRVIDGKSTNDIIAEKYIEDIYTSYNINTTSNSAEIPADITRGIVVVSSAVSSYSSMYTLSNPITDLEPNTTYNLIDYTTYPRIYQFTTLAEQNGNIYFKKDGEYKLGTIYVKDTSTNTYKVGTLYRKTSTGYVPV